MSAPPPKPLRIAAINFLNPAPLMWDFEHPPRAAELATRYAVHYTEPALCARQLLNHEADIGLIPIAALTPELAIVPGCTIASLDFVRSILLLVKHPHTLDSLRTVAADTASRSSVAYAQVLLRRFHASDPAFLPSPADPTAMLAHADAALLIGDPALLAREHHADIEAVTGPLLWIDLAHEWHTRTGLPWVAAVWAVRPQALTPETSQRLVLDLNRSRDHGLAHIDDLVDDWTPRIALPPSTIREYITRNIHYQLDDACIRAILHFRQEAASLDILPPLLLPASARLRLLAPPNPPVEIQTRPPAEPLPARFRTPGQRDLRPTISDFRTRSDVSINMFLTPAGFNHTGVTFFHSAAILLATAQNSNALIHFLFRYGLIGIFLVSIVDSSFVPLPIPGITDIMLVFFAAQHANLFLLVFGATVGSAIGGYLSYQVGHAGGMQFLEKHVPRRIFRRVTGWMENHALIAVALPALLPPPMPLSPFVLAAGALKMSKQKFLTTFTLSRAVRHILAAWLGVHYGKHVLALMDRFSERWATTALIAIWSLILIGCGIAFWKIYQTSRSFKGERSQAKTAAAA